MSISHPQNGTTAYDHWAAEDKGPSIIIASWTFTGLAIIFVGLRGYVRGYVRKELRSDDYWCFCGLICTILSASFTTVAVHHGNGRHYDLLTTTQQEQVQLWTTAAFVPGVMSFGFPKVAVVALLTRLLNPKKLHRYFLWFLAIWCLLTLVATFGTLLGRCVPVQAIWDFSIKGKCVDPTIIINFSLYAGTFSAFVDVYLAIYPTIVLFKLQMKVQRKIALSIALGIGMVGAGIAIYKTTRIPAGLGSPDFSYDSADLAEWTIIEGSTIIIACTIPVLGPLMEPIFKGHNPFSRSKGKYQDHSSGPSYEHELKPRNRRPAPYPELETTVVGDAGSSEEDILQPKYRDTESADGHEVPPLPQPFPRGQILRTDSVTVTNEAARRFGSRDESEEALNAGAPHSAWVPFPN